MSTIKLTATGGGGGTVSLKAPAATTSNAALELTLPVDDGTSDQYLKTDGSGVLSFGTVSTQDTLSFRNLIVNGACNIAQRGTTSTSSGYYTVDRMNWGLSGHSVTVTQSQHALTNSDTGPWEKGFRNSAHIALSAAGTMAANTTMSCFHKIEAQDIANSGWDYTSASSYITLSFWFKVSTAQTFYLLLFTSDGTAKSIVKAFTPGNTNWNKFTFTIPGASGVQFDNNADAGLNIGIVTTYGTDKTGSGNNLDSWGNYNSSERVPDMASTWLVAGASTYEFTGLQLEVGNVGTEFEHKSYQDDFLRCCRYYQELAGHAQFIARGASNTIAEFTVPLIVPLRASPTVSKTNSYYRGYDPSSAGNSSNTPTVGSFMVNKPYMRLFLDGFSDSAGIEDDKCATIQQWSDGVTKFEAEL